MLLQDLPESVIIDGIKYPIASDFKALCAIELCLLEKTPNGINEKLHRIFCGNQALDWFYKGNVPTNKKKANYELLAFHRCYKEQKESTTSSVKKTIMRGYDFEVDSGAIFSAFLLRGIDLTKCNMHWFKFKAIFQDLPEDCLMRKLMHWRTADTSKMGKSEKAFILERRKENALDTRNVGEVLTVEDKDRAMLEYVNRRYEETKRR